jgi:leucyl/phenylalanyl-tRNA--protein transferase
MFTHTPGASKLALAALVAFCRRHGIGMIDCQQNTAHLASMGAREMDRADFIHEVSISVAKPAPAWRFDPVYWGQLMPLPDTA